MDREKRVALLRRIAKRKRDEVLGGLTTFSTFSGESLALMQKGDFTAAAIHSAVHLLGCLAAAAIGFRLMR